MASMHRREFTLCVALALAGCKRDAPRSPAAPSTSPAPATSAVRGSVEPQSAPSSFAGAATLDELKDMFVDRYRAHEVDGLMALFYLHGASQRMVDLYRDDVANPEGNVIADAQIADITAKDRKRDQGPSTLEPEEKLLLKFGPPDKPQALRAVEQFFYIGRHDGRYFLTLPTGD